ncbi:MULTISPECIES: PadR family transcriptional regulator [unclassified Clostridium]|uniref:PadR family transcriptional regulator n=1 Tax=unclassified Clostridium TaxID=2614128 RepID=UPI000297EE17|nr:MULTISPECIES: PadR family transcriptional regulator [unclassified Clostridium]EKQ57246.1 MAG: putative transcriptional regulator [Clostridium sp. Maddingley MBC34-26]
MTISKTSKKSKKGVNLLGPYKPVKRTSSDDYKAEYNRMFPTKMSSSNFLLFYTLFLLNKKSEPLYGKEMLIEIQRSVSVDIWKPSHGTYYPLLEEMVKAGYIEIVKNTTSKKFYSITELGKKELELRLAEFKPMLIKASDFFSKVSNIIYDSDQIINATITNIPKSNHKLVLGSDDKFLEMLSNINIKIEELKKMIENECIEIKVIKSIK